MKSTKKKDVLIESLYLQLARATVAIEERNKKILKLEKEIAKLKDCRGK